MSTKTYTYASAGVDIDAAAATKRRSRSLVRSTSRPRVLDHTGAPVPLFGGPLTAPGGAGNIVLELQMPSSADIDGPCTIPLILTAAAAE